MPGKIVYGLVVIKIMDKAREAPIVGVLVKTPGKGTHHRFG